MAQFNSPEALSRFINECKNKRNPEKITISVCNGTGCKAGGATKVIENLKKLVEERNLDIEVLPTGCHGFCERGPLVVVKPDDIFYQKVKPSDVEDILDKTVANHQLIPKLLYRDEQRKVYEKESEVPFYKHQERIVFEMNGHIDPQSLEDYMSMGGFEGLTKVLTSMDSDEVISYILKSGLRGRGGAGFPTALKWKVAKEVKSDKKYVVCNADEGDPGAFMDRSVLEGNPFLVLEGMLIGAYAIGADEGYIYVRNEYPMAVEHVGFAIEKLKEFGILGENILGSGFNFNIHINRGGGAFVCGEETALIASIEGRRGMPSSKPPFPAQEGLWGKPTNINNVETWANIPYIIRKGWKWFSSIGTGDVSESPFGGSKGTKIFSLVGKVNNTGLVEVPMGITLREIVYDIGGGIKNSKKGRTFKAVQTGGPSGGCIPAEFLDNPVDFDELTKLGSMMGSGGMIVMDDHTCMVEVARYFVDFLKGESCGKCTPCREGLRRMSEILNRIVVGKGVPEDIQILQDLGEVMREASLCGLGQTAANPVLSTLKYFREEYEEHIRNGYCRAKACTELIKFKVDEEKCTGCTICARKCPTQAITGENKKVHHINQAECVQCGVCYDVCNFNAIEILSGPEIQEKLGE